MAGPKKQGQTVTFQYPPVIIATATAVGAKEGRGPLGNTFDKVIEDPYHGEKTWEKAERRYLEDAVNTALAKAGLKPEEVDFFLAGDLCNQITASGFTARQLGIPFLGLYGACASFFEGLALGAMLVDGGFADRVLVAASSHCCTAERQFRFPTEQGVQRSMTAQWTVTGAGAAILARPGTGGSGPVITHATVGRVIDLGIGDPSDFGSAMAPAAADTIISHFRDTARGAAAFDMVITGDLGHYGRSVAAKLLQDHGYDPGGKFEDCGILIYDRAKQDTHAGGSGCGCSAAVFCGHLMQGLQQKKINRLLGVGTGALLSAITSKQGETIPAIGHGVVVQAG